MEKLIVAALALAAGCSSSTRNNPASEQEKPPDVAVLPAQDAPPPPCVVPEALLDEDGRLACQDGLYYAELGPLEECRAVVDQPVLLGPDVNPGERVLGGDGERPSWWAVDGLVWLCGNDAQRGAVVVVHDFVEGCWVRCWGADEEGRCAFCSGADTCVPCDDDAEVGDVSAG